MKIEEVTTFVGRQVTFEGGLTYYRYAPDEWYIANYQTGVDVMCQRMMCMELEKKYQEYVK